MTRSIVWFLLVLSLLFNVFFVFGYMQAKASSQIQNGDVSEANRVTEFVGNELKLDNKQRELFSRLRSEMRDFKENIALADQELLNELGKPQPDLEKIRVIASNQVELNNQRRSEGSQKFNTFLKALSPDQCKRISDRVGRGHHGRDRFRRMFDENKDGKVDEKEMAKAKAKRDAWRENKRADMLERYDADSDGNIDNEEWGAMLIERYDANGNGELDNIEIGAMRAMRENGSRQSSRQRRGRRKEGNNSSDN